MDTDAYRKIRFFQGKTCFSGRNRIPWFWVRDPSLTLPIFFIFNGLTWTSFLANLSRKLLEVT